MKLKLENRKKNTSVFLAATLIVVSAVVIGNKQAGRLSNELVAVEAAQGRTIDVLGESYEEEGYKLTFANIRAYTANEVTGKKRITADLTVLNTSQDVLEIAPGLQMFIKDQFGMLYAATANYLAPGEVIGGPLKPGHNQEVQVDFELPDSSMPNEFIFQKDQLAKVTAIKL